MRKAKEWYLKTWALLHEFPLAMIVMTWLIVTGKSIALIIPATMAALALDFILNMIADEIMDEEEW